MFWLVLLTSLPSITFCGHRWVGGPELQWTGNRRFIFFLLPLYCTSRKMPSLPRLAHKAPVMQGRWHTTLYNMVIILCSSTYAVTLFPCTFLFSGLKNGKWTWGKLTYSGRTAIGWIDLRAKWPDTINVNRPFALRGYVTSFLWKWKLYDFAFKKWLVGHVLNKIIVILFFKPAPFS